MTNNNSSELDWLDDDFGLDEESDRTIEQPSESLHPVPPIPGLEDKYEEVHISFAEQTFYGISKLSQQLVEIPRSEWMPPEQYREWLAAGSPRQIHLDEDA